MSSLVEIDPLRQNALEASPPLPMESAEQESGVSLLELAWRSRWLILLCTIVGAATAWLILQRVTPLFTSVSRIYVERNLPRLLDTSIQLGQSNSYLFTQAELIQSTPVLAAAVNAPGNSNLSCFREVDNRVALLQKNLVVSVGSDDEIINVALELPDAREAAQLVNSVVDAYVTKYAEQRRTDSVEVLNILRNEKHRRDAELEERQRTLQEFRHQHPELAVRVDDENLITQQFAALAQELSQTEIELLQAKAQYYRVRAMYKSPDQRPLLTELAMSSQQGEGQYHWEQQLLLGMQKQAQEIEMAIVEHTARWGVGHPRVKQLRETFKIVEERLTDQKKVLTQREREITKGYVNSVRQQYELLTYKRKELQASYNKEFARAKEVSSQAIQLATLEDDLARTMKLSDILDERIKEVNLTEEVGAMNVSIMEVAAPNLIPSYPIPSRFIVVGVLLGGLTGFGLAWLRDLLDHRLKSIEEITNLLNLPVLGAIRHLGNDAKNRSQAGRIIEHQTRSTAAESFRTLRTAIHFGLAGDDAKTMVITSSSPGDGKSVIASNLAIAFAQSDKRVLLIDGDMRKPRQHQIFDVESELGFSSVLSERRPVEEAIVSEVADSLDLLPCGPVPSNPVELLNNEFCRELIEHLELRYDKIIIDTPPVLPVADARVLAAMCDSVILVLKANKSTRRLSLAARNELWQVRAQRIGVVVNAVPKATQSGFAYGYGYGYGGYGYGYGYGPYGYTGDHYGVKQSDNGNSKSKQLTVSAK